MHHLYLSIHNNATALQQEREALVAWCVENGIKDYAFIEDDLTMGRIPEKRIKALIAPVKKGDTIVVAEMSRLGRSLSMFQTVMNHICDNGCTVITLDGRTVEPGRAMALFVNALGEIVELERRMKAFRSNDAIYAMREDGTALGRPAGTRKSPEKNVLYGKTDQLVSLYKEGLTLAGIAERLGVSRGTVSNYLRDSGLSRSK